MNTTVWVALVMCVDNECYADSTNYEPALLSVHSTRHGAAAAISAYFAKSTIDPDAVRPEVDSDDERWTNNPLSIPVDGTDGSFIENEQFEWSWEITEKVVAS